MGEKRAATVPRACRLLAAPPPARRKNTPAPPPDTRPTNRAHTNIPSHPHHAALENPSVNLTSDPTTPSPCTAACAE